MAVPGQVQEMYASANSKSREVEDIVDSVANFLQEQECGPPLSPALPTPRARAPCTRATSLLARKTPRPCLCIGGA